MSRHTFRSRNVDAAQFSMVPAVDVPRSAFDLTFSHKTTFDAGKLIPIYVDEVLPGDSHRVKMTAFGRLATPLVPVMDNIVLETFFFFVPNRLVWSNWERFMGEQASPSDTTTFLTPQVNFVTSQLETGDLGDYFGITLNYALAVGSINVQAMPFRAYWLIVNEWFRDEDLQDPVAVQTGDGPDNAVTDQYITPAPRGKRQDYFTTARPWPQKPVNMSTLGNLSGPLTPGGNMTLPQSGAPVSGLGVITGTVPVANAASITATGGRTSVPTPVFSTSVTPFVINANPSQTGPDVRVLINDIRTAQLVQLMMERNSRGGTRYVETIWSHFRVRSPDARLQRPEYLGGGRSFVNVNPIGQTSATGLDGGSTVLGEQAGVGTMVAHGHGFSASFTEHGHVIGLVSVRNDLSYQNGVNRMWFRRTQYDFFWPGLQGLGEQPILSKELFANGDSSVTGDDSVFGFQERWSEYKYRPSRLSGQFRSNSPTPLDYWHLSENFTVRPALNATFVADPSAVPLERALQVDTLNGEQIVFDSVFDVRYVRAMSMRSIPGVGLRL